MSLTDREARRAPTQAGAPPAEERVPVEVVVVAVAAVVLGIGLRFVARTPLWLDEALSVEIARLPLGDIADALRHDGHPPLYYVLLHGWMELVGTGDTAVRALSGVFAVVTLPLAWLAGRRRGGLLLAWIAVAVVALAPYALRYATETRMYSLVMLLVFAGWLLVDRAVREGPAGPAALAGIALVTAALLYTHYWAMWLVAATVLVVGRQAWRGGDDDTRRRARRVLGSLAVGGVLFLPWLGVLLDQARHTGTPWAGPQRPTSMVASTLTDFGGGDFRDAELVGAVLLLLALLAVFGRAVDARRIEIDLRTVRQFRFDALVAVLALGLGALVSYLTWSAYATRYAAVVFPLVALLVAGGVTRFAQRWVRDGVFVALLGLLLMGSAYNLTTERSQSRVIGDAVAAEAAPGDLVVYCPDQLGPAGAREMPVDVEQVVYPTMAGPERVDWWDYAERNEAADPVAIAEAVDERAGAGAQVFLVWSPSYATFEGQCEALFDALAARRPGPRTLVGEDGDGYYEHAQLTAFPARA